MACNTSNKLPFAKSRFFCARDKHRFTFSAPIPHTCTLQVQVRSVILYILRQMFGRTFAISHGVLALIFRSGGRGAAVISVARRALAAPAADCPRLAHCAHMRQHRSVPAHARASFCLVHPSAHPRPSRSALGSKSVRCIPDPPPRTTIQRWAFGTKKGLRRESSLTARGPLGLAQASPNTLNTHDTQ